MSDTEQTTPTTAAETKESPSVESESQSIKRSLSEQEKYDNTEQHTEENDIKRIKPTSPFNDLKISDDSVLNTIKERTTCVQCNKSVKYFCYRCFSVVGMDRSEIPYIKLPVPLNV